MWNKIPHDQILATLGNKRRALLGGCDIDGTRFARVVVTGVLMATLTSLSGCGVSHSAQSTICEPGQQITLLPDALMPAFTPSAPFSVSQRTSVWAEITTSDPESLLPLVGDSVYPISSTAMPKLAQGQAGLPVPQDDGYYFTKAGEWKRLNLPPGEWKIYLSVDRGASVVSCPL